MFNDIHVSKYSFRLALQCCAGQEHVQRRRLPIGRSRVTLLRPSSTCLCILISRMWHHWWPRMSSEDTGTTALTHKHLVFILSIQWWRINQFRKPGGREPGRRSSEFQFQTSIQTIEQDQWNLVGSSEIQGDLKDPTTPWLKLCWQP